MSTNLLVTVGTDHHPFDRLIRWVEGWAEQQPAAGVDVFMQIGTSRAPEATKFTEYLDFDDLMDRIAESSVVVCHGGPSTISHCLRLGVVPIVVPREHGRGEHVDDHQVAFSTKMAEHQGFATARTEAEVHRLLDDAAANPDLFRLAAQQTELDASVDRFSKLIDDVLDHRSRHRGWRRRLPRRPTPRP